MEELKEKELIGHPVRKFFKGFGYFHGTVVSFDKARQYFKIEYTDGDTEEQELHELKEILVPHSQGKPAKRAGGGRPRKNAAKRRKIVAEKHKPGDHLHTSNQENVSKISSKDKPGDHLVENVGDHLGTSNQENVLKISRKDFSIIGKQDNSGSNSGTEEGHAFSAHNKDVQEVNIKDKSAHDEVEDVSFAADVNIRPLPPSSVKYNLTAESLLLLFSTYAFLRSFSLTIFLSPFSFEALIQCLCLKEANALVDQIHLSLLSILRQELEILAKGGVESAAKCLRSRDWRLLDIVTWPSYLLTYLLNESFSKERQEKLAELGVARGEYYELEAGSKISMLSFLCDHVLDTDKLRAELTKRTRGDTDFESTPFSATPADDGDPDQIMKYQTRNRSSSKRMDSSNVEVTPKPERDIPVEPTSDGNSDDCVLCGMDGSLLCCDGCPAAYHSRCVGVSKTALPEGDWYCPECRIVRDAKGGRPSKGLRGFENLGVDLRGRRYMTGCEHIFISESSDVNSSYTCYARSDIPSILEFLEADGSLPAYLRDNIGDHLAELPETREQLKTPEKELKSPGPCTTNEAGNEVINLPTDRKPRRTQQQKPTFVKRDDVLPEPFTYVNHYMLGAFAAQAASCLSERVTKRNGDTARKSQVSDQLKVFCQAPLQFHWPSFKRRFIEAARDRCGWCISCKCLTRKRGCLLNTAAGKISAGAVNVVGGLRPLKKGPNHFPALAAYILSMEERMNGLLGGPWENFDQRKHWRKSVERADNIQQLKTALLELGSSLRTIALTRNWTTIPEDAPRPPGALNVSVAVPTRGRRRKRTRQVEVEEALWRRGGTLARRILDWECIPVSTLKRAARQGGAKKISGLLYSDALEIPRRTAQCAWLTRVESSATVSEIAVQVRFLDALVRWSDLSVPEAVNGFSTIDSVISSKASEGNLVKYFVDSSKTEEELKDCLKPQAIISPSEFIRIIVGDSVERRNGIWLPETQLPLCLVKDIEEKWRNQMKPEKPVGVRKKVTKVRRSERFRKLLKKFMAPEVKPMIKCRRCDSEIPASLGISCRKCEGTFHAHCMNRYQTDLCQGCFSLSQNKRSRRLTLKAMDMHKTPDIQQKPSMNSESGKKLLVYSRRNRKPAPPPIPNNAFGAVVVKKKRSKLHVNYTGVQWNHFHEAQTIYRQDKVFLPGQCTVDEGPQCALCLEPYDPDCLYIGCEHCQGWFHGVALGITEGNIGKVASFKCHACRNKGGPSCPHTRSNTNVVSDSKENFTIPDSDYLLQDDTMDSEEEHDIVLSEIGNW